MAAASIIVKVDLKGCQVLGAISSFSDSDFDFSTACRHGIAAGFGYIHGTDVVSSIHGDGGRGNAAGIACVAYV